MANEYTAPTQTEKALVVACKRCWEYYFKDQPRCEVVERGMHMGNVPTSCVATFITDGFRPLRTHFPRWMVTALYCPHIKLPDAPRVFTFEEVVAELVEAAMNDPEGETNDGARVITCLEEMAWDAGWTKAQTAAATDWAAVGKMALSNPAGDVGAGK